MVTIELLATEKGWKFLCDKELIQQKMTCIYNA
jgi:hypothetical protein